LKPSSPAYQFQEAATRVEVVLVLPQVLRELVDALCQEGDLHLRRAYVPWVGLEVVDDLSFCFFGCGHAILHLKLKIGAP
jgi:hypothetical protein